MTDTKIIYIQDDRSFNVEVQFYYSKDMQMIDNWIDATYGDDQEDVFHSNWECDHPETSTGVRNLQTTELKVDDFISMCNTLDYVVKRVKNEVIKGDCFKVSCSEAYPEDFK